MTVRKALLTAVAVFVVSLGIFVATASTSYAGTECREVCDDQGNNCETQCWESTAGGVRG